MDEAIRLLNNVELDLMGFTKELESSIKEQKRLTEIVNILTEYKESLMGGII